MALSILIREDGQVIVSVGGVVIAMVKSISIEMDTDVHPVPHISIVMAEVEKMPDHQARTTLLRMLMNYKAALAAHPLVHVVGYRDTLRSMPAVREEDPEEGEG